MVGLGRRVGGRALHGVKAQHLLFQLRTAAARELARVEMKSREARGEKISIQREHDLGLGEVVHGLHRLPEGHLRARVDVVAVHRLPLNPLGLRVSLQKHLHLRHEGRRGGGTAEHAQPHATLRLERFDHLAQAVQRVRPGVRLAHVQVDLRAVRVIQPEHAGLGVHIGSAQRRRMLRIAFDLGRTAFVALHQQPRAVGAERHRRGVKQRLAQHQVMRLPHVGNDRLQRLPGAGAQPGQRQRGAHDLHEVAARTLVRPLRGVPGKLPVQHLLELGSLRQLVQGAPVPRPARLGSASRAPRPAPACPFYRDTHRPFRSSPL